MYCLGHFCCIMLHMWLSICTFLQIFMALSLSVFELCWFRKKKKMNKTPYHSPIHLWCLVQRFSGWLSKHSWACALWSCEHCRQSNYARRIYCGPSLESYTTVQLSVHDIFSTLCVTEFIIPRYMLNKPETFNREDNNMGRLSYLETTRTQWNLLPG